MEKEFECIKIKDGLYIGNKIVAMDLQFLIINKFAYIINCAAQVPNLFESQGIRYIKFKIHQDKNQQIFDEEVKRLKKMKKFVEEAEQNGMCCLIHCGNGYNRSLTLLTAYVMDRFKWRLLKAIDFLQSKGVTIMLTESNIQQLKKLELILSQQSKLTQNWGPPFVDDEQQLITKTFMNTSKKQPPKMHQPNKEKNIALLKKEFFEEKEVIVEKTAKRVQWQDKIDKQLRKEKKLLAERVKQEKKQNERSRVKFQQQLLMKDSKAHNLIIPKDKVDLGKKMKKKVEQELDPEIKKKIQEAEILKLIKKSGKLKKQLMIEDIDDQPDKERQMEPLEEKPVFQKYQRKNDSEEREEKEEKEDRDKKVYKLTINNYINPSINIIKPPLDKKKKTSKVGAKKEKDKFNRTYSQKETFKKPTFYDKQVSKDKQARDKQKRNTGLTPVRSRKQRKSQKEKDLKC